MAVMDFTCWSIFAALLVRILFAGHSFMAIWRLTDQTEDPKYWAMTLLLLFLLFETIYIIKRRKGREWKWFSPSVFFYLLCTIPTIWFLELDRIDTYKERLEGGLNGTNSTCEEDIKVPLSDFAGLRIPLKLSSDDWLSSIEQMLVFLVIVGRWLMPNRKISHDELSLLLFVYLGMGSDIMELLDLFEEDYVLQDDIVIYVTLAVWSVSLFQFTIVLTTTRSGSLAYLKNGEDSGSKSCLCCTTEIWSILMTMFLQDGPFLAVRLYVIIKNQTLTYTILFFTLKNILMLLVQTYRLFVVGCCHTGPARGVRSTPRPKTKNRPVETKAKKKKPPKKKKKKSKQTEENNVPTVIPQSIPGLQDFTPEPIQPNIISNVNPGVNDPQENIPTSMVTPNLIPNGNSPAVTTQYHPPQTIPIHPIVSVPTVNGPSFTGNQYASPTSSPAMINPPATATQTLSPQQYTYQNMNTPDVPPETSPTPQNYGYLNRSSVPNEPAQIRPNLRYSSPLPAGPMSNMKTSSGGQQYGYPYNDRNSQISSGLHNYGFPSQTKTINTVTNVNPALTGYHSYSYPY